MTVHFSPEGHVQWLDSEEFSTEFLKLLGAAQEGGSMVSECFQVASRIDPHDRANSWYREWLGIADRNAAAFQALWKKFRISNDDFIRTTEPRHRPAVDVFLEVIRVPGSNGRRRFVGHVSNVPGAEGLEKARRAGVETLVIDHKRFGKDREAFEREIDMELSARAIDIVALAGFMRVLTPFFVRSWAGHLVNIHPSLLPKYPGTKTHERALEAGDSEHGATVHLVVEEVALEDPGVAGADTLGGPAIDSDDDQIAV